MDLMAGAVDVAVAVNVRVVARVCWHRQQGYGRNHKECRPDQSHESPREQRYSGGGDLQALAVHCPNSVCQAYWL